MPATKKFLDAAGVTYLAALLDNYPNNEILGTVITAIQDALDDKVDKSDLAVVYSGNSAPSNNLGNNGDIYLQTA